MPERVRRVSRLAASVTLLAMVSLEPVRADAWLDAGDATLRHHLQFLVDTNVIDLPLTAWPIPAADVAAAISRLENRDKLAAPQQAALSHVERKIADLKRNSMRLTAHAAGAARPVEVRTFENTPREEGELGGSLTMEGSRFSARLAVSGVSDPEDHQPVRLDGTYGTVRLGNWLVTAGALDRWWGAGWDGSLILSNNARPIPAISLDRESSQPFESPWLSWIGSWRVSTFMGHMETEREDRDHPLFFGMRVTFRPFSEIEIGNVKPLDGIEFSLERTAQWCAEGLPCGTEAFWNVLAGNDNEGETVDPEDEPGNQLAGWSLRYASPWKYLPLAYYRQKIGETIDLDSPLPRRTLDLHGLEYWGGNSSGYTWRVHAEYADTACSAAAGQEIPAFDCAYNNALFPVEGYRYRGRVIGHSLDGDGISRTLGVMVTTPRNWGMSLLVRSADVNRGGSVPDDRHTVSTGPVDLRNIEVAISIATDRGSWGIGAGLDETDDPAAARQERNARGFAEWRIHF